MIGIYKIQSKKFKDRCYIGSASNTKRRWTVHLCNLRKNKHHSPKLQHHYNKYGEEDLEFIVIIECDKNDLLKHEQYFLDSFKPYFNICMQAGSRQGTKMPPEVVLRLSQAKKGTKLSEEHKRKCSESLKGHKTSEETKRKIGLANSIALKGKKQSQETIMKRKESNKGFKHSEESKAKVRKARKGKPSHNKGKPMSEEQKIKISNAHKGVKLSESHRKAMSLARKGKKQSEEAIENRRKGLIESWRLRKLKKCA